MTCGSGEKCRRVLKREPFYHSRRRIGTRDLERKGGVERKQPPHRLIPRFVRDDMNARPRADKKIRARRLSRTQQHVTSAVVILDTALIDKYKVEREAVQIKLDRTAHKLAQPPARFLAVAREKETADAVVLELHVAEGDMGKVIGKQGRIAKAIRTVVKASVDKGDKKIVVDIQ